MSNVRDIKTGKPLEPLAPRVITYDERMQCLLLAEMNHERAEIARSADQAALGTLLDMNAEFLRSLAK